MMAGRTPRILAGLVGFGVAFGVVEAAVVIDLRAVYEPLHARLHPGSGPVDLFPLLSIRDLRDAGPVFLRLLGMELVREAATLAMLAAVALVGSRNAREWFGGFLVGFGVWDLAFYGVLRLAIGWPETLLTWDLLFLLPVPWSAPVLAPMIVAVGMVLAGARILMLEGGGRSVRMGPGSIGLLGLGASTMLVAFCWDYRAVMSGGMPGPFPWMPFGLGFMTAATGLGLASRPRPST